jgi:hypothetical protein
MGERAIVAMKLGLQQDLQDIFQYFDNRDAESRNNLCSIVKSILANELIFL